MTAAHAVVAPFRYDIRRAETADHRFIVETTAKVRQPGELSWREWERRGTADATRDLADGRAFVVEADRVLLAFVVMVNDAVTMLYVKRDFRGLSFGLSLLTAAGAMEEYPRVKAHESTPSFRAWCKRRGLIMIQTVRGK